MKSLLCLALVLASMPGCSGVDDKAIDALKQQTLDQLVFVEGGKFIMGDVGYTDENGQFRNFTNDANVFPEHEVTLTSYSVLAHEVTFKDYDLFTSITGSETILEDFRGEIYTQPNYPADGMTWYQARDYCQWLGQLIGYPMDLPTEAQWEYAARSRGKAVAHATNNGDIEYGVNYRDPVKEHNPMPVGSWPPNPLGIYDMTGNVDEWTLDYWRAYREEPLVDPVFNTLDPLKSEDRVTRGSGVIGGKGQIQLYRRAIRDPNRTGAGIGIRCVANHPEPIKAAKP
ncbi:formylglycine-generating enzyme family protein [Sedimenticola sp.]|uniref:formylglycine-generating enzyme family protein n=1 Tax=Sedimenticola sp. TaxID=1940285 RepID=UPI003D0DBC60